MSCKVMIIGCFKGLYWMSWCDFLMSGAVKILGLLYK